MEILIEGKRRLCCYFIGFDIKHLIIAQELCVTGYESLAVIEAETEYFKGPFHSYFM